MARGNAFNDIGRIKYDVNELNLANGKRLDSYIEGQEIISRKATDLENIELATYEKYLQEMHDKYAPGTVICSNKYPELDGKVLSGELVLEIPASNKSFSRIQEYIDLAKNKYGIRIKYLEE